MDDLTVNLEERRAQLAAAYRLRASLHEADSWSNPVVLIVVL